jgi:hypothetical protein
MALNLEQQKLFFSYNHTLNDSLGTVKIEVIVAVVILSLASSKRVAQAARTKPKHISCPNQAMPGCPNH